MFHLENFCLLCNDNFKEVLKKFDCISFDSVTKDNIHLYYEFMGDEDLKANYDLISGFFENRIKEIMQYMAHFSYSSHRVLHGLNCLDTKNIISLSTLDTDYNSILKISFYGIKDTLKPIDEYIAEIKASSEYQVYVSKNKPLLKCYSIVANGVFYFINKHFYYLNNDDKWGLVSSKNKINELWELRKKSTEWELVTGSLLESLNKHISTK